MPLFTEELTFSPWNNTVHLIQAMIRQQTLPARDNKPTVYCSLSTCQRCHAFWKSHNLCPKCFCNLYLFKRKQIRFSEYRHQKWGQIHSQVFAYYRILGVLLLRWMNTPTIIFSAIFLLLFAFLNTELLQKVGLI